MSDGTMAAKFEQDQAASISLFVEKVGAQDGAAGVAATIHEAVSHERLFVFGELLALEKVQALKGDTTHGATFKLLELFAYGTFASASGAVELTPAQAAKLRLLTIVSLARNTKVILYEELQRELQISEIRELEDTVIESIYQGLLVGKLNQKHSRLDVLSTIGRDVNVDDIVTMQQQLAAWGGASRSVVDAIEQKTQYANDAAAVELQHQAELSLRIEQIKATLKVVEKESGVTGR